MIFFSIKRVSKYEPCQCRKTSYKKINGERQISCKSQVSLFSAPEPLLVRVKSLTVCLTVSFFVSVGVGFWVIVVGWVLRESINITMTDSKYQN